MCSVDIFTDGSCLGNPGPGGYGVVLRWRDQVKELSVGYYKTTNNRMELMAVIVGLEALHRNNLNVRITLDSQYVKKGITQWILGWEKKGWKNARGQAVLNQDLWKRLQALVQKHKIEWIWVKGHNAHPENTRCDRLAYGAAQQPTLQDLGYISLL